MIEWVELQVSEINVFIEWTRSLASVSSGRLIVIDGTSLRRSFTHGWNKGMVHLVIALCGENQLVLGQLAVDCKSNEITALPKLLELLHLKEAVQTVQILAGYGVSDLDATAMKLHAVALSGRATRRMNRLLLKRLSIHSEYLRGVAQLGLER